jgi:hypothetical protein
VLDRKFTQVFKFFLMVWKKYGTRNSFGVRSDILYVFTTKAVGSKNFAIFSKFMKV